MPETITTERRLEPTPVSNRVDVVEQPKSNVSYAYDGSYPTFRMLHAFNWGPMLLNLGWFPFRGPLSVLNLAVDFGKKQMALAAKSIRLLKLQSGNRVLDVACGRGKSSYMMGRLVPGVEVVGLDLLPENVQLAERVYGSYDKLRYEQGTAVDLNFEDESFDCIHCLEAAHHFPDRKQFLCEAFRVLRPGGRLVVVDFVWTKYENRRVKDDPRMRLVRDIWQFDDFHCIDEYVTDSTEIGFEVQSVLDWTHGVTRPFQTMYDWVVWLTKRPWGRRLVHMSNDMLGDMTDEDWEEIAVAGKAHRFATDNSSYVAFVLQKPLQG